MVTDIHCHFIPDKLFEFMRVMTANSRCATERSDRSTSSAAEATMA